MRTGDVNEVRKHLGRLYRADIDVRILDPMRARAGTTRPGLLHRRIDAGAFSLEDVRHGGQAETRADDVPGVVVLWTVGGQVDNSVNDAVGAAGPGDVVLGSAGNADVVLRTRDPLLKTAVLDQDLLDRVAADSTAMRLKPVRFTSITPRGPESAAAWIKVRRFVEETVLADEEVATPLVIASAARLLAATTLAVFPNTASEADDAESGADLSHHPALVRRAVGYIEEHASDDIGVVDIAAAVYVTPRALQYMFRRHLDTTPMAYLRRVRLDHVHRALREGTRDADTVTAIAARWGFAHTGRFAVLYRETFGQSPHVTLRQ
ncbi:helix-turn-helix domain-containing protein [Mycolicibacterium sediminis]|uniref:helix-turn-helix domain-containing protein n=1 Tax=Mycolicibacterium sediminis TaxID=1286180 RepID=UPI001FE31D82|nr:helix-turn-helix domain-containing protein [Mycolicibacterium sediminis]